jgi:2-polyprenyl-3-methyl-5-hydroxy-6-metoxy-1,4-benzoquinol methylase
MLAIRSTADELMDDPALPLADYAAVIADLAQVNRVTMAARPTLGFLKARTKAGGGFRLLDVGYGHGDMLRRIEKWAAARDITADLVGIDLNPSSEPAARAATIRGENIDFRTGDYVDLADEPFDFIISSLVAHHMSQAQLIAFLAFMDKQARQGWLVNDLHRHSFAYLGFPLLARLFRWHPIVRHDGQLSIARSYRPSEWPPLLAAAGVKRARVFTTFPFRLCVESHL